MTLPAVKTNDNGQEGISFLGENVLNLWMHCSALIAASSRLEVIETSDDPDTVVDAVEDYREALRELMEQGEKVSGILENDCISGVEIPPFILRADKNDRVVLKALRYASETAKHPEETAFLPILVFLGLKDLCGNKALSGQRHELIQEILWHFEDETSTEAMKSLRQKMNRAIKKHVGEFEICPSQA